MNIFFNFILPFLYKLFAFLCIQKRHILCLRLWWRLLWDDFWTIVKKNLVSTLSHYSKFFSQWFLQKLRVFFLHKISAYSMFAQIGHFLWNKKYCIFQFSKKYLFFYDFKNFIFPVCWISNDNTICHKRHFYPDEWE